MCSSPAAQKGWACNAQCDHTMSLRPQRLTVYSCMRLTTADRGPKEEAIVFSSTCTSHFTLSRSLQLHDHH